MTVRAILQLGVYLALVALLTPIVGRYMAAVFSGRRHVLASTLGRVEAFVYRCLGVDPAAEMSWQQYAGSMALLNALGMLSLILLEVSHGALPLNPQHLPGVRLDLAVNTAISFMTNTNWQAYSGETTMSYLTDLLGLTVQNFLSAATGIAVLLALVRGLTRRSTRSLGNFWVDMVRATLFVLLPLSVLLGAALISQGVVQNLAPYTEAVTAEGARTSVPQGPAASQVAIKQLGSNGGGFFGTNSAFPLENPTPVSNFLQMFAMLLLPSGFVYAYGLMTGSRRHGCVLWGCMMLLLLLGIGASLASEHHWNPVLQSSDPMEGKETRFGCASTVVWSVITTATSNGSVNGMHDSLSPLSGGIALLNIMLGEIVFGGVGSGVYGIVLFILLTVFIAGLMVGRTPEYLGKKVEAKEIKMAVLAVLAPGAVILAGSALAAATPDGIAGVTNPGPHGLTQIVYAFTTAAGNNGSAFAGLSGNSAFYNLSLAVGMLIGRFAVILPVLAIAGSLASKTSSPFTSGTFRTDTLLFAVLLLAVILIVGALTFFPILSLGPIVEQFLLRHGAAF